MTKMKPNILILCMDQWQARMEVPKEVNFPALDRLESQGVSLDRYYCPVPICTPSRGTMWTGLHAQKIGLWDNTNYAWIDGMPENTRTLGHLMREQGYYTSFKGKWHITDVARSEEALEKYGFSDYQGWGDNFGPPLGGAEKDCSAAYEAVDWLEHRAPKDKPWMMICSLVNPHDIMFMQPDPSVQPHPKSQFAGLMTPKQRLSIYQDKWDVTLPSNFEDGLTLQPAAVHEYKKFMDLNYGAIPKDRPDLWLKRRNYFINAMRMVNEEFMRVLEALDRQRLWDNTVVVLTGDHGDMNGAHGMTQKGAIHYDEASLVNFTVCVPGGPRGKRSPAVGSHLDLVPTLLEFSGLSEREIHSRYPDLKGRSLKEALLNPKSDGPRGSARAPGDGALICWDGLNMLDAEWSVSGALLELANLGSMPIPKHVRTRNLLDAGKRFGAPDFKKRGFFRAVVDGRYKLVRWFSPENYGNPSTVDELYATSDVTLHDLEKDPGELENIGNPKHPLHDQMLVQRMLAKLHRLVQVEIGEDRLLFDLNMFGTRAVKRKAA